ncbi:protein-L-isoaspartate O-methyltransferase [Haloactinospora alba]|uniref:Protein-L-isoaspartate O-methyltransferase n=1 Tax=Haloactinospora alba TaxID=405555 RepID=A0A543NM51_9ACTN|nr:methyltransferase domain-containing protein [Haloactinospora alba]TQN32911.1 protein-L-isoaspartate O-methyltransferase [Haloactinospora alba]
MVEVTDERVERALRAVPESHYRGADGRAVRQRTDTATIARHLRLLDPHPGQRVLEVGTGSGLSTALLAETVGPRGHVVSIDLEETLVERAARLHVAAGYTNVTSLARDGRHGAAEYGPFDRIVAWATPEELPGEWLCQAVEGARVLLPLPLAPVAYATGMLRATVGSGARPRTVHLHRGAYGRMHTPWHVPVESGSSNAQEEGDYVSATWLRGRPSAAEHLLRSLRAAEHTVPSDIAWPQSDHLRLWLLARRPQGLVSTGRGTEIGYGVARGSRIAVHTCGPEGGGFRADASGSPALRRLRALVAEWDRCGRPTAEELTAALRPTATGWRAHVRLSHR